MTYQQQDQTTILSGNSDNLVGQVVGGRYQVLSLLGRGGMSCVYKAQHQLLRKTFALKVLHSHLLVDTNALVRFRQEASAASSLNHPNIIGVFDFDTTDGRPFQAIDYLEGTSLADEIKKKGRLPVDRAVRIWIQIAGALEHAHSRGIIHRDLKPSNVMLISHEGQEDFVKLLDFGIAKVLPQEGEAIQQLTQTGEVFGSPLYMSPEQCVGRKLDLRSDIYSMGCLMYESVVGKTPFVGDTVFETIQKHIDESPPSVRDSIDDPSVGERLDYILLRALAKDPDERYQSMGQLRRELEALQKGKRAGQLAKLMQRLSTARIKAWQRVRKLPVRILAGTAVAVLVCLVAAIAAMSTVISAKVPGFTAFNWPYFSREVTENNQFLAQNPEVHIMISTLKQSLDRMQDPRRAALRWRDIAAAQACVGEYGEAREAAYNFYKFMALIHDEQLKAGNDLGWGRKLADFVEGTGAVNRGRSLADYMSMADAFYCSDDTDKSGLDLAEWLYALANEQFEDRGLFYQRRMLMKRAGIYVRMGDYQRAQRFLLKATGEPEFRDQMFRYVPGKPVELPGKGISDRALFKTLVGETARNLNQPELAIKAYASAAAEWQKLYSEAKPGDPLKEQWLRCAAQCNYYLGKEYEHTRDWRAAVAAFDAALHCYESQDMKQSEHRANAPAVTLELAHAQAEAGDPWDAWLNNWRAHSTLLWK